MSSSPSGVVDTSASRATTFQPSDAYTRSRTTGGMGGRDVSGLPPLDSERGAPPPSSSYDFDADSARSRRPFASPHHQAPFAASSKGSTSPLGAPQKAQAGKAGYSYTGALKWVGVALALTSLAVGVIGLLVYLGQLNVGWAGAGSLSQTHGLYVMLGGLGAAAITTILLTISCCMNRGKDAAAEQRKLKAQHDSQEI